MKTRPFFYFVLTAAASLVSLSAAWQVGLSTSKITPEKPLPLAGYAARTNSFNKVELDIYAKALALADDSGKKALLITTDLCTLPADVVQGITKRLFEGAQLPPERIILSCSHTHSGPQVSLRPSAGSGFPAETREAIAEYTRGLQDKLVEVGESAIKAMAPAELSFGKGIVHFPMNRREFTPNGVILGVNARGFADRSVPVLAIKTPDNKVRAVLFVCACHGTTVPSDHLGLNGDYAGYAQALIESRHPGAQAMFMMGCGGDANPHPRTQHGLAERHGRELGEEVLRVLETKTQPISGPLACMSQMAPLPLEKLSREDLEKRAASGPSWQTGTARQLLQSLGRGESLRETYDAPITVWQFGTNLTWVALPGEVVSDYVLRLEEALGPLNLVVTAYANDVFGYLPSARTLREGGYETRGLFSGTGWFAPEVEEVVIRTTSALARKAGRQLPATPVEIRAE